MTNDINRNIPVEATRTPGSAEGERDPAEQHDRADESIVGEADDEDEFDDDEMDEDDEDEDDESAQ